MALTRRVLLGVICFSALISTALAQGSFYLKDGDRVVFYGDSITDQRLYTVFTETYVVTRFPNRKITFVHSGWGGDRVTGGGGGPIDKRLERDVIIYKPTVMTIMLGMNDASYRAFDQGIFDTYANGYKHIIEKTKAAVPGIRFTLIDPSPYDDVTRKPNFPGGYNEVLLKYGEFVKQLSKDEHVDFADLNTGVVLATKTAYADDTATAQKINPDRVHPAPGGQLLMAAELLKAWKAPTLVSSVEIDAARKRASGQNTKVTGLTVSTGISWTQLDGCLPMPVDMNDPVVALSIKSSDFVHALNQQPLRVTGLKAARYALKIDGQVIGEFTKEKLGTGVNLATLNTPMSYQAAAVHQLTRLHIDIHFTRWRQVQVPHENNLAPYHATMEALDTAEAGVVTAQRTTARPKPHTFELIPQ
jgi:lysophospholipase L1-like esterase